MGGWVGGQACWVEGGGDAGLAARDGASLIGRSEQWSAAPLPEICAEPRAWRVSELDPASTCGAASQARRSE